MRKRVYIACPITLGDLHLNVSRASLAFLHLSANGYAPFNPAWSVFAADTPMPLENGDVIARGSTVSSPRNHAEWLDIDLRWVKVAEMVVRLPGESAGADEEVRYAESLGIPVYHGLDALLPPYPWRQSVVFADMEPVYAWAYREQDLVFCVRHLCLEHRRLKPESVGRAERC